MADAMGSRFQLSGRRARALIWAMNSALSSSKPRMHPSVIASSEVPS